MPTEGRGYEDSHPWLSFDARALNDLPAKTWMLIGEARSKCGHLAGTPLKPTVADAMWRVTLIKGALATTAIEGNTLTEDQVAGILDGTYKAPESRQYQEQEARNVLDALQELDQAVMQGERLELTPEMIREFNRMILKGLDHPADVVPGEIRSHSVAVGTYRAAPWEDCEHLLAHLCEWLEGPDFKSDDPTVQFALTLFAAELAHLYLAWIHPFGDGNGRTARLVEFVMLARSGHVPLPAAHLLSNHYNLTRDRYYAELDRASRSGGDIKPFVSYATQGFVDGIREEIDQVRTQQYHVSWINYVHEAMATEPVGKTCERRRALVLALPFDKAVPRADLTGLTPKLAREYAQAGDRTLSRDLNRLADLRLIRKQRGGYLANAKILAAFMPPMADPDDYVPDE